jgi:hypothetical protein
MTRRVRRLRCWPTAEQDQLLRAALLTGEASRAAWDAWQVSVDITRIDEGSARLLPLLSRHAARLAMAPPLASRLRDRYRNSWSHNQVLFRRVVPLDRGERHPHQRAGVGGSAPREQRAARPESRDAS